MILIENNQTAVSTNTNQLKKDAAQILSYLGYADFDLGIMLADNQTMQAYNKKYRDKDAPTDILSFPFYPNIKAGQLIIAQNEEVKNLGDIIIAPEFVQNDLLRWNQTLKERMHILLIHGICHLLGYDHIKDEDFKIMQEKEKELLEHIQ